jgi:hypothetical protein
MVFTFEEPDSAQLADFERKYLDHVATGSNGSADIALQLFQQAHRT